MKAVIVSMKQKQMKILAATTEPTDEQSNSILTDQKSNRQIFLKILENLRFLSLQGLAMFGDSNNEIFILLLKQGTILVFING